MLPQEQCGAFSFKYGWIASEIKWLKWPAGPYVEDFYKELNIYAFFTLCSRNVISNSFAFTCRSDINGILSLVSFECPKYLLNHVKCHIKPANTCREDEEQEQPWTCMQEERTQHLGCGLSPKRAFTSDNDHQQTSQPQKYFSHVPSPSTWAWCFFINRGYDWSRECWKSFEKRKQKVSSTVMEQTSQETGPGSDATFHTIGSQQWNQPCPRKPAIVLEHATAAENHI